MLQSLRVKNLAIVEDIEVEFGPRLNTITGETGAGKSILMSALALVLGDRADRELIRTGQTQCSVEAEFFLERPGAVDAALEELGLARCEEGRLIVRRVVSASGAGRQLINDSATTLQGLKRVGDLLVDTHGPHDHQSLLRPDFQMDLLDAFGGHGALREAYERIHATMNELRARRRELEGDAGDLAMQMDLLAYQVNEIEEAELGDVVEEELRREHTTMANGQRILELSEGVRNGLVDADGSAFQALTAVQGALRELAELMPEAESWRDEARGLAGQLQELADAVRRQAEKLEGDPGRLQWLDERLALIHKLKRKYGGSVESILQHWGRSKERLQFLKTRESRAAELDAERAVCDRELQSAGKRLGEKRRKAGQALARAITGQLQELGFPHGSFDVAVRAAEPGPAGMDEVEFGFAPNPGEAMRPLGRIASSGEISRVMLATKAVLSEHDRIPVLVFDEIDSNVGGEMGNVIGEKLESLGAHHQVLCITHLPQVAVQGWRHLVVSKAVRDGRTYSDIRPVTGRAREDEVVRMLGGQDISSVARRHASEMLRRRAGNPAA